MADIQVTQEIIVELNKFHNVDLFQRGYYQIRCRTGSLSKLISVSDCELKEEKGAKSTPCLFKAFVDKHTSTGISRTFEVYYKHEEVLVKDRFLFKVDMLVDGSKMELQLPQKLELVFDLYFAECARSPATPKSLEYVSSQTLILNLSLGKSFHAYRPMMFDYFHLGALTVTVHSCVVAFRQPWSASLKMLHPIWNGKSGNIRQYCYNNLFGKSAPLAANQKVDMRQKGNASFLHRKLCLQLLKLYEQLLASYHSAILFLPDYAQMRLSKPDIHSKLDVLNNEFDMLATAEELYLRMGDDLYLLSTELSLLWLQFTDQFSYEDVLVDTLATEHHSNHIAHMKEAFFTDEHPWMALCTSHELSTSQQTKIANEVKNSLYYQLIPPVNLECVAMDGDRSTLPIIFEDKYIPGKKEDEEDSKKRLGSFSMTVEESIVGDDFVDMDVSIEDDCGNVRKISQDVLVNNSDLEEHVEDSFDEEQAVVRKSDTLKKYENTMCEDWDFSKMRKSVETDLTGPDYSLNASEVRKKEMTQKNIKNTQSTTDNSPSISIKFESNIHIEKSKFYTTLDSDSCSSNNSKQPSIAEDAVLALEELDIIDGPNDAKENQSMIAKSQAPSDEPKPKLWSCFPAIKSCSSKRSSYKMAMQSPPYMPVARENTSRFQRAKENLDVTYNIPGHKYSLFTEPINIKPYFTERILATTDNVHLVVCVHGLDGNSGDLRLVQCFLEMAVPRANFDFLMSEVNQDDTFCDIDTLTKRLVQEILRYIEDQKLDVVKLSFIGHSLGNVIIRNAIAHSLLFAYRNKLFTFLSLSGPHLGMQFHTSNLVSTGMWLMQKWKKGGSLVQLALNDSTDPRDTFMYRLSLTNGFQYFKNVLLVSSVQDHYVPFHSARVEMSKQVVKDSSGGGRIYKEMLDNIMKPLMVQEEVNIVRYSIYHPMPSSANTFIGRAAHIAMLDSELFLEKFILITASKYFR